MNIVIHSYISGSFLLETERQTWDVIVILDSGIVPTDFVSQHALRHLYLRFDDVDSNVHGKRAPTVADIQSALDFAAESQNLMVCCRAGQSRSAAIAFLICHQCLGPDAAHRLLNPKRHIPNSLVIELGSRLIDDPFVTQTLARWRGCHQEVRIVHYLKDIEREFDELESRGARNRIV